MPYPTPGFVVRNSFLEFEPDAPTKEAPAKYATMPRPRPIRRRCLSDTDLYCTVQLPSQFGSEELRLLVEARQAAKAQEADQGQGRQQSEDEHTIQARLPQKGENCDATSEPSGIAGTPSSMTTCDSKDQTTILLEQIPSEFTGMLLAQTLNLLGFACWYDFVFLPMDLRTRTSHGYAIVNFRSNVYACTALASLNGFRHWNALGQCAVAASWNQHYQGLDELIERYRNSPVMHQAVPDVYKPALFDATGAKVPFPEPTKVLRMPRLRKKASKHGKSKAPEVCPTGQSGEAKSGQHGEQDPMFVDLVASRVGWQRGAAAAA